MDTVRWIICSIERGHALPEDPTRRALDLEAHAQAINAELQVEPRGSEDVLWKSLQRLGLSFSP